MNTDTAATQMARESSRLQRALSTPKSRPESHISSHMLPSMYPSSVSRKNGLLLNMQCFLSLAYDFHKDLLPVLAGLETPLQSGGLWKGFELLLDKVLPLKEV